MKILGIDPALNNCGWSILEFSNQNDAKYIASGVIKNKVGGEIYDKIKKILTEISRLIDLYNPEILSIEDTFVSNNAVSSLKLGIIRGAIMGHCIMKNMKIKEFKPNEIKKIITGNGKADKEQLHYMLKMLLPKAQPETLDESDAIAIALAYCFSYQRDHNHPNV